MKRLLLTFGGLALVRYVLFSSYNKIGPFTNNAAPPVNKTMLDGLEKYLNPGVAKNGVPLTSWFGPYTVTTTYTFFNHNLVDQNGSNATPDIVLLVMHSNSANSLHSVFADQGSMTSTQVKLGCDGGTDVVYGIAMKF
jgi:hypothetical protein